MNSNTINSQSVRKWCIQPEDVVALLIGEALVGPLRGQVPDDVNVYVLDRQHQRSSTAFVCCVEISVQKI